MPAFSVVQAALSNVPARCSVLPPSAWKDTWEERPRVEVAIGLRRLSVADINKAQAEASREAVEQCHDGESRLERYNNGLMAWAVALAACDPNDVTKPAQQLEDPEDTVPQRLTPPGIKRVFEDLEILQLAESPLSPLATDEDLGALAAALGDLAAWGRMPGPKATRARRLARFLLDELRKYRFVSDDLSKYR